ncbi:DUF3237 domain-containing protein [bacterium]|nr:DUF3237 domain-containing protein [bacterium]
MSQQQRACLWLQLILVFVISGTVIAETARAGRGQLQLLFEAELQAKGEVKPFVLADTPFSGFSMKRDLIAQGDGTLKGSRVNGTLSWSKLSTKYEKDSHTNTLVSGWITTEDGAEIFLEAMGYARVADPAHPEKWSYIATVRFEDPDKPYEWLINLVAVWFGEFDLKTGRAHYWAYIPANLQNTKELKIQEAR